MFVNNVRGEIIKYSGSEYLNSNTSNKKIVIRNKTSGLDIYGLTTNVSASVYSPTLNFNGTKAYIGRYETQNENTYSEYQTTSNIINTSIYEEQFSEQNSITRYKSYYTVNDYKTFGTQSETYGNYEFAEDITSFEINTNVNLGNYIESQSWKSTRLNTSYEVGNETYIYESTTNDWDFVNTTKSNMPNTFSSDGEYVRVNSSLTTRANSSWNLTDIYYIYSTDKGNSSYVTQISSPFVNTDEFEGELEEINSSLSIGINSTYNVTKPYYIKDVSYGDWDFIETLVSNQYNQNIINDNWEEVNSSLTTRSVYSYNLTDEYVAGWSNEIKGLSREWVTSDIFVSESVLEKYDVNSSFKYNLNSITQITSPYVIYSSDENDWVFKMNSGGIRWDNTYSVSEYDNWISINNTSSLRLGVLSLYTNPTYRYSYRNVYATGNNVYLSYRYGAIYYEGGEPPTSPLYSQITYDVSNSYKVYNSSFYGATLSLWHTVSLYSYTQTLNQYAITRTHGLSYWITNSSKGANNSVSVAYATTRGIITKNANNIVFSLIYTTAHNNNGAWGRSGVTKTTRTFWRGRYYPTNTHSSGYNKATKTLTSYSGYSAINVYQASKTETGYIGQLYLKTQNSYFVDSSYSGVIASYSEISEGVATSFSGDCFTKQDTSYIKETSYSGSYSTHSKSSFITETSYSGDYFTQKQESSIKETYYDGRYFTAMDTKTSYITLTLYSGTNRIYSSLITHNYNF